MEIEKIKNVMIRMLDAYAKAKYLRYVKYGEGMIHIMRDEIEVQIPSDIEKYEFPKGVWDVKDDGINIVLTKR